MNVTWLFRKKRILGNFSIENSFAEIKAAWPRADHSPNWHELSDFSEGWHSRLRIILETRLIRADILHISGDVHFAALAWPKWRRRNRPKLVLTIHDIGFLKDHQGVKRWLMRKVWIHWPLRCIDHLITVSEATKDAVLREAPWFDASKITVIPTVVPQHFKPRKERPKNPKPVAIHIGLAGNKNLKSHAEAIRGMNIHLKIIGEPGTRDLEILDALNIDFSCQSRLTDEGMQEAYASSDFLLFASTLEGFGMPILEAQMVGLPVITSNIEPMKGVAGEGALLSAPLDVESIRNSVEKLLNSEKLSATLVEKGYENVCRFHPKEAVQAHVELYKFIASMQRD